MTSALVEYALVAAQVMLGLAMLCAVARMIVGPRAQDRVLALDALYVTGMLMLVTVSIRIGTSIFFEVALVIGMLGFVSTVAFAKFLMRGEVIE